MTPRPYRFLLRMPEELRRRLNDSAASSGRSLNAEVVHRLEESFGGGAASRGSLRRRRLRWPSQPEPR